MKKALLVIALLSWATTSFGTAFSYGLTATASKYEKGNKPDNALDQDGSTWWTCRGYNDECWLQMDIGKVVTHNEIWLVFKSSFKPRENFFDVRISVDGTSWQTVYSGSDWDLDARSEDYDDEWDYWGLLEFDQSYTYRYVRIYGHGNSVDDHNSIAEIGTYSPESFEGLDYG